LLALALVVAAGCDDSGSNASPSKPKPKPARSTTTTSSAVPAASTTTTASTAPGAPTSTTVPGSNPTGTCGGQTAAIVAAIQASDDDGLSGRVGQYTVQDCRVAPSNPIWAAALAVPNPGVQLDTATILLERIGALWNVVGVGTSNVGCQAPAPVQAELSVSC
jgi:hypothetical protein